MPIVGVDLNIGENWVQNVVYMNTERNCSVFLFRLFLTRYCFFLCTPVQLLWFFKFGHPDLWPIPVSRPSTSSWNERCRSDVFTFKVDAVFIEWGSRIDLSFLNNKTSSTSRIFAPRFPEIATKGWYRNLFDMISGNSWKTISTVYWIVLEILLDWLPVQSFSC